MSLTTAEILLTAWAFITTAGWVLYIGKYQHIRIQWLAKCDLAADINNENGKYRKALHDLTAAREIIATAYKAKDRECEKLRAEKSEIHAQLRAALAGRPSPGVLEARLAELRAQEQEEPIKEPIKQCHYCHAQLFDYPAGSIGGGETGKFNVDSLGETACANEYNQYHIHVPTCDCGSGRPLIVAHGGMMGCCEYCISF